MLLPFTAMGASATSPLLSATAEEDGVAPLTSFRPQLLQYEEKETSLRGKKNNTQGVC